MNSRLPASRSRLQERNFNAYDFRSRQPAVRITAELTLEKVRDTARIDAWLTGPFAIPADRLEPADAPDSEGAGDALARAVVQRVLALYGDLLRAAGIPCFDPGRTLAIRPLDHRPHDRAVVVLLPVIDHVPAAVFPTLFRDLLKIVLILLVKEPRPELVERVFDDLQRAIVDKLTAALAFNPSSLPLCKLAYDNGIPYRHIGNGFIKFGTGARAAISRGSAVERDSALGAQICIYKQITAGILRSAGLPAPRHAVVESSDAAFAAAHEIGWPVVVKPSNQERSQGVTVDIADDEALIAAYGLASAMGGQTMVERQVPGVCHRIMVANGQLVYCVIRYPKGVIGNGRETIAELVGAANAKMAQLPPWRRLKDVPLDGEALRCIADQGLTPESVPTSGQRISVRTITSGEWGGDIENLTATIHPDNVDVALRAARLLGLSVAGIDLMTTDITRPWHENGAAIIEVNFDPQFATSRREDDAGRLLSALVEGDGRIPVRLVTGEGDLLSHARRLRSERIAGDRSPFLTTSSYSEDHRGQEVMMTATTLFDRSLALAMRPDVHELIVVGAPGELFEQGIAVDMLDSVHIAGEDAQRRAQLAAQVQARFKIRGVAG